MPQNNPVVTFFIRDFGNIKLELFPTDAPNTVRNFLTYVTHHYYEDLRFHRIIKGFMIQGGHGPSLYPPILGEFSANGFDNTIRHAKGVISMARTQDKNSQTSQFFIMHEAAPHLDGHYAAFGQVRQGMDVVDRIAHIKTDAHDKPLQDVIIEKVVYEPNGYELTSPNYVKKG